MTLNWILLSLSGNYSSWWVVRVELELSANCTKPQNVFILTCSHPCHPIIINCSVFFCRWVTGRLFLLLSACNCANVCVCRTKWRCKTEGTWGANWHQSWLHTRSRWEPDKLALHSYLRVLYNCFRSLEEAPDYQWPNRCSLMSR